MKSNHFGTLTGYDLSQGICCNVPQLQELCADAIYDPEIVINGQTFFVCAINDLGMPEKTLLVTQNLRLVKTTKSLETLFYEYGKNNMIHDWHVYQQTLQDFLKTEKTNYPYFTVHEAFTGVNRQMWVNINLLKKYRRTTFEQQLVKTRLVGPRKLTLDLPLDFYCFRKKLRRDNFWFLTFRTTKAYYFAPNELAPNIYLLPTPVSQLLIAEERNGEYQHMIIPPEKWHSHLIFFEVFLPLFKKGELSEQAFEYYKMKLLS